MTPLNVALQAYFLYLNSKGVKRSAENVKQSFINEKELEPINSEKREKEAAKLAKQWDLYRTGDIRESKTQQLKSATGTTLSGATAFQHSMANNYMLTTLPRMMASMASGGVSLLKNVGIQSDMLNSIGVKATNISSSLAPMSNIFRYAQYVNPMYAATDMAMRKMLSVVGGMTGNPLLTNMLAGPLSMMILPAVSKLSKKVVNIVAGGSISRKHIAKLKPISIDAKLHDASEFINDRPIQDANMLLNQVYALDSEHKSIDVIQNAQLQYLAEIAAYTSSIPILASEIINNFIKKDTTPALTYNRNLTKLENFYKGKKYSELIEKRADRMEHGQFAHSITENIGLAATEASSFLNKMSIMLDPIKQIQMVLSGKNIKDEINKFNKAFQTTEQRKSSIFSKKMGIGDEESYTHMYFSLTEDSQSLLSRAKTFEDAQIGLLAGIYEYTRLTALEIATIRTKAYGVKEPVKYNTIGNIDSQAKSIFDWMSNKIPMFEFVRTASNAALNVTRIMIDKFLPSSGKVGSIKKSLQFVLGKPSVYRYHNDIYNRMAEGFDLNRESTLFEKLSEPFIDKLNKALLKTPLLKIFANENRMSLVQRKKLKYQEDMSKEVDAIMKEMGLEKLESQQLYYRYATTTMPEQYDLMVHHLSNIALFTHAIMLNTAALSRAITGNAQVTEPNERVIRSINRYTGRLETDKESQDFMESVMNSVVRKAKETAFEDKKSWARALDTIKYATGFGSRNADDEKELIRGVKEGFKHIFEREKNTAEESWSYVSDMMYRALFSRDFLEKLDNPEYAEKVLNSEINSGDLLRSRYDYGVTDFTKNQLSELEAQMMKVDVAKITAPELLKFIDHRAEPTIITNSHEVPRLEFSKNDANDLYAYDLLKKFETATRIKKIGQNYLITDAISNTLVDGAANIVVGGAANIVVSGAVSTAAASNTANVMIDNAATRAIANTVVSAAVGSVASSAVGNSATSSNETSDTTNTTTSSTANASKKLDTDDTEKNTVSEKQEKTTTKAAKFVRDMASKVLSKAATGLTTTEMPEKLAAKATKSTRVAASTLLKKTTDKFTASKLLEDTAAKNMIIKILGKSAASLAATEAPEKFVSKATKTMKNATSVLLKTAAAKITAAEAPGKFAAGAKSNIAADNTIEGAKKNKNELLDAEEEQTEKLSSIKNIMGDIKKLLAFQQIANTKNKKSSDSDEDSDEDSGSIFDLFDNDERDSGRRRSRRSHSRRSGRRSFSRSIKNGLRKFSRFAKKGSRVGGKALGAAGSALGRLGASSALRVTGSVLGNIGTSALTGLGSAAAGLIANPVGLAVAATAAAASSIGYGMYSASYGREKALIDELEQAGVVEHNYFGNSRILRWDIVQKLPLEQLTQLLSFDDWSNEDKKVLQDLVSQKTKKKTVLDAQRKNVLKSKKDFDKFIEARDSESREKQGFFGYWLGKGTRAAKHGIEYMLTAGGLFGNGSGKDKELYSMLEKAGVIEYSTLPFVDSKVRDWDTITKLNTDQLKSLLNLNWDDETEKNLKEILATREKQKMLSNTSTQFKNILKNQKDFDKFVEARDNELREKQGFLGYWSNKALSGASHVVQNVATVGGLFGLGSSDEKILYSKLEDAGVIKYSILPFLESEVTDWDTVSRLSVDQLKSLLKLNWDDKTESYIKDILNVKQKQKQKPDAVAKQKAELKQKQKPEHNSSMFGRAIESASSAVSKMSHSIYDYFAGGGVEGLLNDLKNKGVITSTSQGLKINDWNEISKLSADNIKLLSQYSGYVDDSATRQNLQIAYDIKTGKLFADEPNVKKVTNHMRSKVDIDTVTNTTVDQNSENDTIKDLFGALIDKLDQLTAVTAAGHTKQIEAALQTAKELATVKNDEIKHPIIDF